MPREKKEFSSLDGAKKECNKRTDCNGVLHADCTSQSNYYLCKNTARLVTKMDSDKPSCFYQKYIIGEKNFLIVVSIANYDFHTNYFDDYENVRTFLV